MCGTRGTLERTNQARTDVECGVLLHLSWSCNLLLFTRTTASRKPRGLYTFTDQVHELQCAQALWPLDSTRGDDASALGRCFMGVDQDEAYRSLRVAVMQW